MSNAYELFLTDVQVAKYLNVSLAAVRRWRLVGEGPPFRKFASLVRYPISDLDKWIESRIQGGGSS